MGHTIDDSQVILLVLMAFTLGLIMGVVMAKHSAKKSPIKSLSKQSSKPSHLAVTKKRGPAVVGIASGSSSDAHVDLPPEVVAFLPSRKIEAIKEYRELTGVGLKEAKDMIDAYCRQNGL